MTFSFHHLIGIHYANERKRRPESKTILEREEKEWKEKRREGGKEGEEREEEKRGGAGIGERGEGGRGWGREEGIDRESARASALGAEREGAGCRQVWDGGERLWVFITLYFQKLVYYKLFLNALSTFFFSQGEVFLWFVHN